MDKKDIMKELARRELARRRLDFFVKYTFPQYEMTATQRGKGVHKQIIDVLEKVERGETKRLMIFCPPRTGKSLLVSTYFPTWCIGKDPKRKVLLTSYGFELASDFGRKARYVVQDPLYKNIFNSVELAKDKSEASNWETNAGGGFFTTGIGGPATGKGGDILIIDDPVKDRQEARSETIQKRNIDWYRSVLYTRRQSQDSAIVIMMTRRDTNDLAGILLEEEANGGDKREKLVIQGIDKDGYEIVRPGKWDKGYMEDVKNTIGSKDFAALYQQDPIAASGSIFNQADFRYFLESDFDTKYNKNDLVCGIFIDPAFSSSNSSDDAAVILVGKHKISNDIYVLDVYGDTSSPTQTFQATLSMAERWKLKGFNIDFISIETVNLSKDQNKFYLDFLEYLKRNDRFYNVYEYKPKGKKEERIRSLEPRFALHQILFRSDVESKIVWKKIERQLLDFPDNDHDDMIDVLAQSVIVFEEKGVSNTQIKIEHQTKINPVTGQPMNGLGGINRAEYLKKLGIKI